ncbi:hypothetical protein GDO81_007481 [Engystomops pustulosus]|uniref:Uncharacterized protein n=1 Tax=Engystomops pustulosus TaxID=76066 RepID=A0AAV7C8G5_ENGPU|nr:hypothetical protein GDO81_007481 [Engystomops pustulosus]
MSSNVLKFPSEQICFSVLTPFAYPGKSPPIEIFLAKQGFAIVECQMYIKGYLLYPWLYSPPWTLGTMSVYCLFPLHQIHFPEHAVVLCASSIN